MVTCRSHCVSVLTIADHEVTGWRDHRDPIAVFNALGCPPTRV
jgi:hypothetical protein